MQNKTLFFCSFLVLYLLILVYLCNRVVIWEDEAYSLHTTANNLSNVISQSYNFEGQPPLYFILLSFWRKIDSGIVFARMFSLLFIGLAAYFFYQTGRLFSNTINARWVTIIFLLNPFTFWVAINIRLYAFIIFLSISLIFFLFSFYETKRKKYLYYFLVIGILGIYTQYLFVILILALTFSVFLFKGWKHFYKLCLYLIPVALLCLPNLLFLNDQLEMAQSPEAANSTIDKISIVLFSPEVFIYGRDMMPSERGVRWAVRVTYFLFIAYTYLRLWRKRKNFNSSFLEKNNIILFSFIGCLFLITILLIITNITYYPRYMAVTFPLFILIFILFSIYNSFSRALIYGIVSIYFITLSILNYRNPIITFDYKSIAKYINRVEHDKEPILFYHNTLSLPFVHYYKGVNSIIPLPHDISFDKTFFKNIKDTFELKESIKKIQLPSGSFLLVTELPSLNYSDNDRKMVDNYFSEYYKTTLDTLFFTKGKGRKIRVRRLEE